jgi:hypothetical protein
MGFGLVNAFIDYFTTRLGTTSSYSSIVNFHNPQFTTAPTKSFTARCVFTSRYLAMTSNGDSSSVSRVQVLPSATLVQNCLTAIPSTEQDRHLFSTSLAYLSCTLLLSSSRAGGHFTPTSSYSLQKPTVNWALPYLSYLRLEPLCTDWIGNILSNNISIVAYVFVGAGTCLPSRCLAVDVSGSTIPAFRRHVTIRKLTS